MKHDLNYIKGEIVKLDIKIVFAYISGSIIEGFGNKKSDLDIFVVCNDKELEKKITEDVFIISNNRFGKIIIHEQLRYDVEFICLKEFVMLCNKIDSINFWTDGYLPTIDYDDLDFLHRLKCSKPLINEMAWNYYIKNFQFIKLGLYIAMYNSLKYYCYLEDIEGAILSEDFGSAYVMVKKYIYLVIEAYLAIQGETNPNSKWIFRKIIQYQDKSGDTELLNKYLYCDGYKYNKNTFTEYYENVLDIGEALNTFIQKLITKVLNNI